MLNSTLEMMLERRTHTCFTRICSYGKGKVFKQAELIQLKDDVKVDMNNGVAQVLANLINRKDFQQKMEAFSLIERHSMYQRMRSQAWSTLGTIFRAHLVLPFKKIKERLIRVKLANPTIIEGLVDLHMLFKRRAHQDKAHMFSEGKRLYQEYVEQKPKKRVLAKSNSLLLATSNNVHLGLEVLEKLAERKLSENFRYLENK